VLELYTYFRSSAAYRVRIALNLKGLEHELHPIHLLKDGGQQFSEAYKKLNPQHLVPCLVEDGEAISQSLSIIEYLDEKYPDVPLLPKGALERARVRTLSQVVACDIHPLHNLRILKYLKHDLERTDEQKLTWAQHWVTEGFEAFEKMLKSSSHTGKFCHGDQPTMADLCLIPQVRSGKRFAVNMDSFPLINQIYKTCLELPEFIKADPANQPDAE